MFRTLWQKRQKKSHRTRKGFKWRVNSAGYSAPSYTPKCAPPNLHHHQPGRSAPSPRAPNRDHKPTHKTDARAASHEPQGVPPVAAVHPIPIGPTRATATRLTVPVDGARNDASDGNNGCSSWIVADPDRRPAADWCDDCSVCTPSLFRLFEMGTAMRTRPHGLRPIAALSRVATYA
jgi:hypothetical protein